MTKLLSDRVGSSTVQPGEHNSKQRFEKSCTCCSACRAIRWGEQHAANPRLRVARRDFLVRGLYGLGIGGGLPLLLSRTSAALAAEALQGTSVEKHPERILVVIELSGGNDGLNTVVPYADPAVLQARPKLGIPDKDVIKANNAFGFHPSMVGFERLYKDGVLGIVHGCGYDQPSLSHFSSMGFWHTGVPNGGEPLGWLGRVADRTFDSKTKNVIVNLGSSQSLAVRSGDHSPLVFDDPSRFRREGEDAEKRALLELSQPRTTHNATLDFLASTAQNAAESSDFVRQATAGYRTPVDYGIGGGLATNLQRVASLISSGMPTRLYYVTYQGNSFDTHVQQADLHSRLLMYTSDAVRGFVEDMNRIGRADQVAVMIFTEFGRRVEENGSLGTDHGTATPMFVIGKPREGRLLRHAPEPHRSRRREHEEDDRLPARLRHDDQGVARVQRHRSRAQGKIRADGHIRRNERLRPDQLAPDFFAPALSFSRNWRPRSIPSIDLLASWQAYS